MNKKELIQEIENASNDELKEYILEFYDYIVELKKQLKENRQQQPKQLILFKPFESFD